MRPIRCFKFTAVVTLFVLSLPAVQPARAQGQQSPAYDGPEQIPVAGQGAGVSMSVALRRGSASVSQTGKASTADRRKISIVISKSRDLPSQ